MIFTRVRKEKGSRLVYELHISAKKEEEEERSVLFVRS